MATSVGKLKVMNATLVIRLCAFAITWRILVSIPQHVRVHYTFRNDPAFLKFYDENIDAMEFMDRVRDAYRMQEN